MSGAVVIAIQKKYVRKFSEANAFDVNTAKSLEELGLSDKLIFRRMVRRGLFREAPNNRFYIDRDALQAFEARRLRIMLVVLFVSLLIMIWGIFYSK